MTRCIIGFGVARAEIDGASVCRMFSYATASVPMSERISTNCDSLFRFHRWLANLRVLEIEGIKSASDTPVSHPFVERLIGTIRAIQTTDAGHPFVVCLKKLAFTKEAIGAWAKSSLAASATVVSVGLCAFRR